MIYNSSQGIFTTMIGFVNWPWPPLQIMMVQKGGQVSDKANYSCEITLHCISFKRILKF